MCRKIILGVRTFCLDFNLAFRNIVRQSSVAEVKAAAFGIAVRLFRAAPLSKRFGISGVHDQVPNQVVCKLSAQVTMTQGKATLLLLPDAMPEMEQQTKSQHAGTVASRISFIGRNHSESMLWQTRCVKAKTRT